MKRRFSRILVVGILVAGSAFVGGPARASHHQMMITEVFLGTGGASGAQYVELTTFANNQHFVDNAQVILYGTTGTLKETATFTDDVPDASVSQNSILVATPDAETLFGVTSDLEFDAQELLFGGKACFDSPTLGVIDCVSWGDYSGNATGAGNPAIPGEGIPVGASLVRDETRGSTVTLDGPDDTNNSKNDFDLATPRPEGGGAPSAAVQRIDFQNATYEVDEDSLGNATLVREGATTGIRVVTLIATNGSAKDPSDYSHSDASIQFSAGQSSRPGPIPLVDNDVFEGPETVKLKVREPTATAVLGDQMSAVLTINDNEDDDKAPTSRITKPKHDKSYPRNKITKLKGTATDGPGTVDGVGVGLRRTMTNGKCEWRSGSQWLEGPCGDKVLSKAGGNNENWNFTGGGTLKRSVGTDVEFYTAYSSAADANRNIETKFKKGRNANRFEVT